MKLLADIMIVCGSAIMVSNIYRYMKFMKNDTDVMLARKENNSYMEITALILLIFFLIGYIGIGLFSDKDILISSILIGGSIFVSIILSLIFHLVDTVKERSLEISDVLIGVIEARDHNLNGHSRSVQNLTMLIYKHLPHQMKSNISPISLEYAALLHDIGKLGIPESILNKSGKLNEEERNLMKEHPKIAVQILKSLSNFSCINGFYIIMNELMELDIIKSRGMKFH